MPSKHEVVVVAGGAELVVPLACEPEPLDAAGVHLLLDSLGVMLLFDGNVCGANLLAAGSFGGTKNGGNEAAIAIEHDDRLKAVFVVMRIEQSQLLAAMNRVERVVDVERDPFGNPLEVFGCQRAVYVAANLQHVPGSPRVPELMAICLDQTATPAEIAEFHRLWQERVRRILLEYGDDPQVFAATAA